jgi:hypothetical protein
MPNYQDGKIYSIRSPNIDKYYIGSTTQQLCRRMKDHRNDTCTSKIIIEAGDSYIELIENYPCNNREELAKREGELIRLHKDNLVNRCIASRTNKEYYEEYKQEIKIKQKQWYDNNNSIILEKKKQYHDLHKEDAKKYREDNKEHIKQRQRERYQLKKQLKLFTSI